MLTITISLNQIHFVYYSLLSIEKVLFFWHYPHEQWLGFYFRFTFKWFFKFRYIQKYYKYLIKWNIAVIYFKTTFQPKQFVICEIGELFQATVHPISSNSIDLFSTSSDCCFTYRVPADAAETGEFHRVFADDTFVVFSVNCLVCCCCVVFEGRSVPCDWIFIYILPYGGARQ